MRPLLAFCLLLATPALAADVVWVTEETESTRFPDSETPGPTLAAFSELSVVFDEGDRYRVRRAGSTDFCWIAKAATTEERPPEAAPAGLDSMPNLDEMLRGLKPPG